MNRRTFLKLAGLTGAAVGASALAIESQKPRIPEKGNIDDMLANLETLNKGAKFYLAIIKTDYSGDLIIDVGPFPIDSSSVNDLAISQEEPHRPHQDRFDDLHQGKEETKLIYSTDPLRGATTHYTVDRKAYDPFIKSFDQEGQDVYNTFFVLSRLPKEFENAEVIISLNDDGSLRPLFDETGSVVIPVHQRNYNFRYLDVNATREKLLNGNN